MNRSTWQVIPKSIIVLALAALVGCDTSPAAKFQAVSLVRIGSDAVVVSDSEDVTDAQRQEIATVLEALFGTPDEPFVLPETGLDLARINAAAGGVWSDESGRKFGLYRLHCAHCHGISGDGYGPTAAFLNPYPRDYRSGLFKFKSTERASPPTSADLHRVLEQGIPGTAMPSFRLLPHADREALVEYVKYLSMRGQMEIDLVRYCFDEGEVPQDRGVLVDEMLAGIAERWKTASESVIQPELDGAPGPERTPEEIAESIAMGRELFYGKAANCFSCHGETAVGDGQIDYDDWNKLVRDAYEQSAGTTTDSGAEGTNGSGTTAARGEGIDTFAARLGVPPPRQIKPRNLRLGVFRGGRRPVDLYWRLHAGINGTPMPAVPRGEGGLTSEQMWQLVDYVLHLPYEPASFPPRASATLMRERL
jgi:mono/diheme cytochrome c family protein